MIVPADYDPSRPLALTFVYHGAGADETTAVSYGLQAVAGAATSSILAFPRGAPVGSYGVGWEDACDGRDMVLFDHMLAQLSAMYCVDRSRVFAAGFSWGCDQVTALACCRGPDVRAIAAASCSDDFRDPSDYTTYLGWPCRGAGATAVRFTHDAKDDGGYTAREFAATAALYRDLDQCSDATEPGLGGCLSFAGCDAPVLDCAYPRLGHKLPPAWAAETWAFFSGLR